MKVCNRCKKELEEKANAWRDDELPESRWELLLRIRNVKEYNEYYDLCFSCSEELRDFLHTKRLYEDIEE